MDPWQEIERVLELGRAEKRLAALGVPEDDPERQTLWEDRRAFWHTLDPTLPAHRP